MSVKQYSIEEGDGIMSVAEPPAVFGSISAVSAVRKRVATREELADCITLEELDRHLTELIHNHYHPAL